MKVITVANLLLSVLTLAFPKGSSAIGSRPAGCSDIHIFAARGTTEQPGAGAIGSLADKIMRANHGTTMEAIDYPASTDPSYGASVRAGTTAVKKQVTAYAQACPRSKLVLLGYSQGAQIVGDALCGGNAAGEGPITPPLDQAISKHVFAVIWYGDPSHVAGKSFNKGTGSAISGMFPRPASQACDGFSNVIVSYCDAGDPYCAGGNEPIVHNTYFKRYDVVAARFVQEKLA